MKNALIVIDVQRHFLKNNLGFVQKVKTLCREYKKVYQIFDSIDSDKPDFIFPNQVQSIEKQYGFDLDDSNVEDYLSGSELKAFYSAELKESNEFEHTKDRTTLEKELSTLVSSDQSGRNKYKEYLKKYTNWQDAAASYASDTGADKNDLFGDAGRISKAQSLIKKHLDVILSNKDILNNAWLLVQHMDNDVKFQTWFLSKLPKNSENYRYLYDRVMVNLERKQKYNTQRMEEKVDNRSKPPTGYKVTPSVVSNEKRIK